MPWDPSEDRDKPQASRRLIVGEAADQLGVSVDAVRGRIKRGTLRSEREGGAVYVLLGDELVGGQSPTSDDQPAGQSELVGQLRSEIAYLREESRRKDAIVMQQAMTMRQLSAPEQPETVSEAEQRGEDPPEESEGPKNESSAGSRRSWWRRLFGSRETL